MNTSVKSVLTGALGTAAWLVVSTGNAQPQDRPQPGNFDPQQMRQRMTERMREQFDVKDDTEWKAISERIDKVMQARRSVGGAGGPGGFGFPGGRAGQGGPDAPDGQGGPPQQGGQGGPDGFGPPPGDAQGAPGQSPDNPQRPGGMRNSSGGPGGPGGFGREPNPELDALRKAIENKASAAEIKSKLADLRAARKQKEAELEKAQDELRKILSARQEAVAVTLGLLK
jgi:hypothetical protein